MSWTIAGPGVRAEVQALGGMVGPAWFRLGDREVQPFAVAPWADDPPERLATLPPLLRRLRGEWPCVPFGMPEPRRDLTPGWMEGFSDLPPVDLEPHGTAAGREWSLLSLAQSKMELGIDLAAPHPVARLERGIRAEDATLHMSLAVLPRADALLPFGVHPTFALPAEPGAARLVLAPTARAWSFPAPTEPGISRLLPDQRDVAPAALRLRDGGSVDATRLPLPFATEELLLLTGTGGEVVLVDQAAGARIMLRWDFSVFPSCLLWLSNRGRTAYPWNGRFLGIGIEPICAPFDLGVAHARNGAGPLLRAGVACARQFRAGERFETHYSIGVGAI